jgi:hypothetical protein
MPNTTPTKLMGPHGQGPLSQVLANACIAAPRHTLRYRETARSGKSDIVSQLLKLEGCSREGILVTGMRSPSLPICPVR